MRVVLDVIKQNNDLQSNKTGFVDIGLMHVFSLGSVRHIILVHQDTEQNFGAGQVSCPYALDEILGDIASSSPKH
jgi:hypothetical protein